MSEKPEYSIRKMTEYIDESGRCVKCLEQVFGKNKEPDILIGVCRVKMKMKNPMGMPVMNTQVIDFQFPEGTGVKKAFETFDSEADKAVKEYTKNVQEAQKKAQENAAEGKRILTPEQAKKQGMQVLPFPKRG